MNARDATEMGQGLMRAQELAEPAEKISQDDPSLQIARPVGRRLRKGPAVILVSAILGVALLLVLIANSVRGRSNTQASADRESEFVRPVIPDSVLNADVTLETPVPAPAPPAAEPLPAVPAAPEAPVVMHRRADGPYSPAALAQKRLEGEVQAQNAGILVQLGPEPDVHGDELPPMTLGDEEGGGGLEQSSGRPGAPGMPGALSSVRGDDDQNMQQRKNAFVADRSSSGYVRTVRRPRSPFELKPGTIVPAVLITAINSDLPGPVIARVTQNICDSVEGQWLLIPQGSTLIADYDSMVAWGQERVLVCWRAFELPNGDSIDLGCMPGADAAGQAGFHDQVDEHWWRLIKGAAVASLLSAVTTAAAGSTTGYHPTVPQMWAHGAATEIGSVGQQLTRRNMMMQPTLTIRQGMLVNVLLTKTLDFRPDGPGVPCRPSGF